MRHLKILNAIWGVAIIFFCPIVYAQPQVREKIPDFTAYTLEGNRISLKDYLEKKGQKVLILYFFAIWCEPCKGDLKYLRQIQDQYGTDGLEVLAVLTPDSFRKDSVRDFMQGLRVDFPFLFDDLGVIARRYGVFELPDSFVIKNDGILRARYSGYSEVAKQSLKKQLGELLSAR
jgi:peroxiredoxin